VIKSSSVSYCLFFLSSIDASSASTQEASS
jgi:hypothetical protein